MGAPHFWGPCAGAPVAHAQGRACKYIVHITYVWWYLGENNREDNHLIHWDLRIHQITILCLGDPWRITHKKWVRIITIRQCPLSFSVASPSNYVQTSNCEDSSNNAERSWIHAYTSQDQCYPATFFNFISFRSGTQVRCYMFQLYGGVLSQTFRHKLGRQEKSLRGRWKMLVGVDYRGQLEKAQESCLPMSWSRSTYKMQQCPEGTSKKFGQ